MTSLKRMEWSRWLRMLAAALFLSVTSNGWAGMFDEMGSGGESKQKERPAKPNEKPAKPSKPAPAPEATPSPAAPGTWEAIVEPASQLFPSFIISTATIDYSKLGDEDDSVDETTIGDPYGMIGIEIVNPSNHTPIKLVISANHYMLESQAAGVMAKAGEVYTITPKINYQFEELHKVRQQMPLNLTFNVWINGEAQTPVVKTVTLRSINDCMLAFTDEEITEDNEDDVEVTDTSWSFAAYVNENHPWINQILKEALATHIVDSFDGYQSEDPAQVYAQVFAIWTVLRGKGVKYSDITSNAEASGRVMSQHVRFVDESIQHSQANCVDGSVMLASIMRKIGLNASLVLVPGHCFLAFTLDEEGEEIRGLETTVIGSKDAESDWTPDKAMKSLARKFGKNPAWVSFEAGIGIGTDQLAEYADALDDEDDADHWLIDLQNARDLGIMPLGYFP